MTAKRLTPAIMRAMEPYLEDLLKDWQLKANGRKPKRACVLCMAWKRDERWCPVFDCRTLDTQCFAYFPEAATAIGGRTQKNRDSAAATVKRLEAVQRWLKKDKEAKL